MRRFLLVLITFILTANAAHAATYAQVFQSLLTQQRATGAVLSGGKVYFYSPGTSNLATIYTDRNMGTPAANPATLSADGTVAVYGNGQYDVKITTSTGVQKFYWYGISLADASNVTANMTAFTNYTGIARVTSSDARVSAVYDLGQYSSLAAAVVAIGSNRVTLRFGADTTVADNLTIPSNIELQQYNGAIITVNTGKTLTFNRHPKLEGGQAFAGSGDVVGLHESRPEWFATNTTPGTTDMTTAIQKAIVASKNVILSSTTYAVSNLNLAGGGYEGLWIHGNGRLSIIDCSLGSSGQGLYITYNVGTGGTKYIKMSDFAIQDSRTTSPLTQLIFIDGGPIGSSPSQTMAWLEMENINILQFNNPTDGKGIHLRNLSSMFLNYINFPFQANLKYGVVIDNDEDINTGVSAITNSAIYAAGTALLIESQFNVLDTFDITGNGFFQHDNALSDMPSIHIKSAALTGISALVFEGNHIERRAHTNNTGDVIVIEGPGGIWGSSISNNHLNCATGNRAQYGIHFTGGAKFYASRINDNEWTYLSEQTTTNGAIHRFENDSVLNTAWRSNIARVVKNQTSPRFLEIETGANEDNIWNSLVLDLNEYKRGYNFPTNNTVISFTPRFGEGFLSFIANNSPQFNGMIYYRAEAGGVSVQKVWGGADFEVTTGALTGTTGTNLKMTISAHTDGKIYIENRVGSTIQTMWTIFNEFNPAFF